MAPGPDETGGNGEGFYRIEMEAEAAAVPELSETLEEFAHAVSTFEIEGSGTEAGDIREDGTGAAALLWRIEAICEGEPDISALAVRLAEASGRAGTEVPDFHIRPLEKVDWLARNREQFPPVTVGGFFLHGSHFTGDPPAGKTVIRLDAGPAFGSGTHETTQGCLRAIEGVLAARTPDNPLDLGCGSGILAIAIAKLGGVRVLASDVDPMAAANARANARENGVGDLVTAICADGLADAETAARVPFDLIVANILAEPLVRLAPMIARALSPSGEVILSGLLTRQEEEILAAYRVQGLVRRRRIELGDWTTLVLRPRGATPG